jgi:hypothetical protein
MKQRAVDVVTDAMQAIEELANEELLDVANKLDGLACLFFCEKRSGRELDHVELNGISAILRGLSQDVHSVYDRLHDIIR